MSLLMCLKQTSDHHKQKVIIESDCLSLINSLRRTRKVAWEIFSIVQDIRLHLVDFVDFSFSHYPRECNMAADFLAKHSLAFSRSDPLFRNLCNIICLDELDSFSSRR